MVLQDDWLHQWCLHLLSFGLLAESREGSQMRGAGPLWSEDQSLVLVCSKYLPFPRPGWYDRAWGADAGGATASLLGNGEVALERAEGAFCCRSFARVFYRMREREWRRHISFISPHFGDDSDFESLTTV